MARPVELGGDHATADLPRIADRNLVDRAAVAQRHLEAQPRSRDARVDQQKLPVDPETQDRFDAGSVEPAGRTRVPGPAAPPDMRRHRIDVGSHDIRLDLVAQHAGARGGVVDGIDEREHLGRLVALAERGKAHDRPGGGVGVLAAVFANAGRVALDVARFERGLVEWWREQERQSVAAVHELAVEGRHRLDRARRIAGARDGRPGLRDGVDTAFLARCGTERRAVVVIASAIPVAVPAFAIDRTAERVGLRFPRFCAGGLVVRRGDRDERR